MTRRLLACGVLALVLSAPAARAEAIRDSATRDSTAARSARRDSVATPGSIPQRFVPDDSLPSSDARAVLRTIPEPVAPDERAEAPDSAAQAPPAAARPDSAAMDTSAVPIPAPTAPLGEIAGGAARSVYSDSSASVVPGSGLAAPAAGAAGAGSAGGAPRAVAPGSASRDTCWRLQIAAPLDAGEAEAKRGAAESQLLVPMVAEAEEGRHKVRSRDCLARASAEALKARALLSGFDGAFLVRMAPGGTAVPVVAPAKHTAPGVKSGAKSGVKRPVTARPRAAAGKRN